MKPIIEEEEDTKVENDGNETLNEVLVPTGGPCHDCEVRPIQYNVHVYTYTPMFLIAMFSVIGYDN